MTLNLAPKLLQHLEKMSYEIFNIPLADPGKSGKWLLKVIWKGIIAKLAESSF